MDHNEKLKLIYSNLICELPVTTKPSPPTTDRHFVVIIRF